jgi:cyclophilin family peptidyl-prolyl cis-trans isomerase
VKISDSTASDAQVSAIQTPSTVPAVEPAGASQGAFGTGACVAADGSAPQQRAFTDAPQQCIDMAKSYVATMKTSKGTMVFNLLANQAPVTVNSFVNLARAKYYDGIYFHRVVPDFVLQAGDPGATTEEALPTSGSGGPGYEFADELPAEGAYSIGSLAMANAGPNTNGSQFFVISGANGTKLPPNYALFGQLTEETSNLDTMNAIAGLAVADGPPSQAVVIESVTITER